MDDRVYMHFEIMDFAERPDYCEFECQRCHGVFEELYAKYLKQEIIKCPLCHKMITFDFKTKAGATGYQRMIAKESKIRKIHDLIDKIFG